MKVEASLTVPFRLFGDLLIGDCFTIATPNAKTLLMKTDVVVHGGKRYNAVTLHGYHSEVSLEEKVILQKVKVVNDD